MNSLRLHSVVPALLAIGLMSACGTPNADVLIARGDAYVQQSLPQEAIIEYRNALEIAPMRGDVRQKLALLYLRGGDVAKALKEYVRAADIRQTDAVAQIRAGNILLKVRAFEDAKVRANKALAIDPKSIDGQILLGNALAGLRDIDGALTEYQEAVALNPQRDSAYINIGAVQLVRGDRGAAEASFRKAIEADPKSPTARLAFAGFLWSSGRLPEAEQAFKDALAIEPQGLTANRALGLFYLSSDRASEAEPYFQTIAKVAKTTDASITLADYYGITQRFDEAKKILTDLARHDDAYAAATLRLASIEASQGNRTAALTKAREILAKIPKDPPARLLIARLLLADRKSDEALAEATTLVKDTPDDPTAIDAYFLIGSIQIRRDRLDDAVKAYEEILRRQSRPLAAHLALASLHLSQGALDKAATYIAEAQAIQPQHPSVRTLRVRLLLAQHDRKAAQELAALERDYPKSTTVLNLVAAQQTANGQLDLARATYAKVAQLNQLDLQAIDGLVRAELRNKHPEAAVKIAESAVSAAPKSGDALMLAAQTYQAAGNISQAETLLQKAIELEPNRLRAYGLLGDLYGSQGRIDDALDQFRHVVELNPKSSSSRTMLAMLLEMQHRLDAAEAEYQKVLAADPRAAVAANNLACLYAAGNRNMDQALQLAQVAHQGMPDEPYVNDTLGWIYYKRNLASMAVPFLEKSALKAPDQPEIHYHLGMAYYKTSQYEGARKELRLSLAQKVQFEGDTEAREILTRIGN